MELLLKSLEKSHVSNILLVALDPQLGAQLGPLVQGIELIDPTSDEIRQMILEPHVSLFKWRILDEILKYGVSVLYADSATLFVSDPFASLYRDADVEAMTLGWDDPSAYGYNHVIDDPSMGFTRYCHGSRIVGYEPRFFYARATAEARTLAVRMRRRLARQLLVAGAKRRASGARMDVVASERNAFTRELWLPSHHNYTSPGAILRVMNYLCFVNSKVLFRQLRHKHTLNDRPVALQINYHSDTLPRLQAAYAHYFESESTELMRLPLADAADASAAVSSLSCDADRSWNHAPNADDAKLGELMRESSPWAWGGVGGFSFGGEGTLTTPWGSGSWSARNGLIHVDFAGSKHNVQVDSPSLTAISTRCGDSNVVIIRSIKAAEAKKVSAA